MVLSNFALFLHFALLIFPRLYFEKFTQLNQSFAKCFSRLRKRRGNVGVYFALVLQLSIYIHTFYIYTYKDIYVCISMSSFTNESYKNENTKAIFFCHNWLINYIPELVKQWVVLKTKLIKFTFLFHFYLLINQRWQNIKYVFKKVSCLF